MGLGERLRQAGADAGRAAGAEVWGWGTAYGIPEKKAEEPKS